MKMPTQPFTVNRPDIVAVTNELARKHYDERGVHEWFNRPNDLLVLTDTPLTPKQWLLGGGSTRKVLALARMAPTRPAPTEAIA